MYVRLRVSPRVWVLTTWTQARDQREGFNLRPFRMTCSGKNKSRAPVECDISRPDILRLRRHGERETKRREERRGKRTEKEEEEEEKHFFSPRETTILNVNYTFKEL